MEATNRPTPFVDNWAQTAATNHATTPILPSDPPCQNQHTHGESPDSDSLPPPTAAPDRKRKREEFTISQKLSILAQLRGKQKVSIPTLAARHNTSRTTIYRWKNDEARLNRLAQRSRGDRKRAHAAVVRRVAGGGRRKSYNDEFTAAEKLDALQQCRENPSASVKEVAERFGTHPRSIYRWKKDEEKLRRLVQSDRAGVKRAAKDGLHRVKAAILQCCWGTTSVTGTVIAAKAKEIRDELLAEHEISPFLTEREVKALSEFRASSSWGRKLIVKFGWKNEEQQEHHSSDAADIFVDGASFAMHPPSQEDFLGASSKQLRMKHQISEMKKEINLLKRKIVRLEMQNNVLEKENSELKKRQQRINSEEALAVCGTSDGVERKYFDTLNPYPLG